MCPYLEQAPLKLSARTLYHSTCSRFETATHGLECQSPRAYLPHSLLQMMIPNVATHSDPFGASPATYLCRFTDRKIYSHKYAHRRVGCGNPIICRRDPFCFRPEHSQYFVCSIQPIMNLFNRIFPRLHFVVVALVGWLSLFFP
jgi:hypothetical protein